MNPRRMLDPETVLRRLRTMRRLLDQLERVRAADPDDFGARLQVERILSALVDLAVAVNTHVSVVELGEAPHDMTASFRTAREAGLLAPELAEELAPSVGLRNVLVHAELASVSTRMVDVERMLAAVPLAASSYARYVEQVASWLRDHE